MFSFLFFFLRLGASIVLRTTGLLVCWEPCVPAGTAGTIWNPYKQEGLCECIVYEVEERRGKGFKKRNPWSTATCFSLDTCSDS